MVWRARTTTTPFIYAKTKNSFRNSVFPFLSWDIDVLRRGLPTLICFALFMVVSAAAGNANDHKTVLQNVFMLQLWILLFKMVGRIANGISVVRLSNQIHTLSLHVNMFGNCIFYISFYWMLVDSLIIASYRFGTIRQRNDCCHWQNT